MLFLSTLGTPLLWLCPCPASILEQPISDLAIQTERGLPDFTGAESKVVVLGQVTNDVSADALVLYGTQLVLLYAPDREDVYTTLSDTSTYTGLGLVRGGGPGPATGAFDQVLAASATGLRKVVWNTSTLALNSTALPNTNNWINATRLACLPLSTGGSEVCGLSADGLSIVRANWVNQALTSKAAVVITGSGGLPAKAMVPLDWNGDGALDYAVDWGAGLRVLDAAGNTLGSAVIPCSSPQLLRLPTPGSLADRLVWHTNDPPSLPSLVPVLTVASRSATGGVALSWPIYMQGNLLGSLGLVDFSGDAKPEVACSTTNDAKSRLLWDYLIPTQTLFLPGVGATWELDVSSAAAGSSQAMPLAGKDLDGDGDEELVIAGHSSSRRAQVFGGDKVVAGLLEVTLADDFVPLTFLPAGTTPPTQVALDFLFDVDRLISTPTLGGVTDVRVTTWFGPPPATPGGDTILEPMARVDTWFTRAQILAANEQTRLRVTVPGLSSFAPQANLQLWTQVRYATRSGTAITKLFPSMLGGAELYPVGDGTTGGFISPPKLPPPKRLPHQIPTP